jgi:hypothetical protein
MFPFGGLQDCAARYSRQRQSDCKLAAALFEGPWKPRGPVLFLGDVIPQRFSRKNTGNATLSFDDQSLVPAGRLLRNARRDRVAVSEGLCRKYARVHN